MSTARPFKDGTDHDRPGLAAAALTLGYLALAVGVLVARAHPANDYEVSIYAATPLAFWAGLGVALAVAIAVAFTARSVRDRTLALALGGLGLFASVALPVVRGYAYYGTGDSLSHLGWTRQILAGELGLLELLYPGIHGVGLFVHATTGLPLRRALLFVVLAFVALFLLFVPVLVATLVDDPVAVAIAAVSGFMLLPINGISAHMTAHPSTMAVLFLPFVLVVLVRYLRGPTDRRVTALGGLLALSSVATTLVHPQQAANLLLVMGAVVALGVGRRLTGGVVDRRRLVGQTAFLGAFLVGWSAVHERVTAAAGSLFSLVLFGPDAPSTIAQRGQSLSAIGGSLAELFVKLFLVSGVYILLAGLLVLAVLSRRARGRGVVAETTWLSVGLVPVGVVFLVYIAVNYGTMYFRQLGFLMAVVTVLGSVALALVWRTLHGSSAATRLSKGVLAVGVGVMLVLSMATLFPSPYIYQPNMHVTSMQYEGYEATFDQQLPGVAVLGVREGPDRFRDAITGTGDLDSNAYRRAHGVPGAVLAAHNLTETYDGRRYLAVSTLDRKRELVAFRGLRYSRGTMTAVGAEPGVHRVRSTGGLDVYLVGDR